MFLYNENSPVTFADPLPQSADVVVIGGGVIGISTAWFLRERGYSVLVCDKGRVAGEQSSRNWGWVRAMWRDPDEVPIALDSIDLWEQFQAELGDGIGFRRGGIVGLAATEEELSEFEDWMDVARANGMDTRMLAAGELDSVIQASQDMQAHWKGGIITPSDARAEPFTAVKTVAEALQARGGLITENCAVRTVEFEAGKVASVATEHGEVRTGAVVCATGAWSNMFLGNLGIKLPQLAVRATVARTEPAPEIFGGAAALHDLFLRRRKDGGYTATTEWTEHLLGCNSFRYFRAFGPARKVSTTMALRLGADPTQPGFPRRKWDANSTSPFENHRVLNPEPSKEAIRRIEANLSRRAPALKGTKIAETWAGMIDATPDIVPVIDSVPDHQGLFVATGFSGHGFGIGPGAGRAMARIVMGDDPGYNMERFRFSRFSDGSEIRPGPAI